jgi:hypothetical protein
MRKIVLSFSLLAALFISATPPSKPANAPVVTFGNLHEIMELYRDGQYDVVKAKLANEGFKVISAEPDYTLHGTTHEGVFKMEHQIDSPSQSYRNIGATQTSYWYFSRKKEGGFDVSDIDVYLYDNQPAYSNQAETAYNDYVKVYGSIGLEKDNTGCNYTETCTRIWGDVNGAPAGYIDYVRMSVGNTKYSVSESAGSKTEYTIFRGNFTFARRRADISVNGKPAIKKPSPPIKRKK